MERMAGVPASSIRTAVVSTVTQLPSGPLQQPPSRRQPLAVGQRLSRSGPKLILVSGGEEVGKPAPDESLRLGNPEQLGRTGVGEGNREFLVDENAFRGGLHELTEAPFTCSQGTCIPPGRDCTGFDTKARATQQLANPCNRQADGDEQHHAWKELGLARRGRILRRAKEGDHRQAETRGECPRPEARGRRRQHRSAG